MNISWFNLSSILGGRYFYFSSFVNEKTQAKRSSVIVQGYSAGVIKPKFEHGSLALFILVCLYSLTTGLSYLVDTIWGSYWPENQTMILASWPILPLFWRNPLNCHFIFTLTKNFSTCRLPLAAFTFQVVFPPLIFLYLEW